MAAPIYTPTTYPWLGFLPSVSVTPAEAAAIADAVAPSVLYGSTTATPASADAAADAVAPTVTLGSVSVSPASADAIATADPPEVVSGAITPASADVIADAVAPTVTMSSMVVTPASADAIADAVTPTVSSPIRPDAAEAIATAVAPDVTITGTALIPATHWFYDSRANAWYKDSFTKMVHDPIAVCEFDGDAPTDRVNLIGGDDGYIRFYDSTAALDDGDNMTSFVTLGPLSGNAGTVPLVLREVQGITDNNSHAVRYEILAGDEPEEALDEEEYWFVGDGGFDAGLSKVDNPRVGGYYLYVKVGHVSASTPWSLEGVRTRSSAIATARGRHG